MLGNLKKVLIAVNIMTENLSTNCL